MARIIRRHTTVALLVVIISKGALSIFIISTIQSLLLFGVYITLRINVHFLLINK